MPPQSSSGTLSFTAASPDSTMIFLWLSPSIPVATAADQLVFWTGTAIVGQTTDLTRLATVLILAVLPIVEWFSSVRVVNRIVSTWASGGSVGVGGVVGTGNISGNNWLDSVLAGWAWAVVSNGFDVVPQTVVAFLSSPSKGPDSMSGFVPVIVVFTESHGETSVALTDSPGAVEFDGFGVVVWPPSVSADNSSLGVVVLVVDIPEEFVTVPSNVRVA